MAKFAMNFAQLYEIDITPTGATRTWKRLAAGLTSCDPSLNEETDQTAYLDGDGFKSTKVIAKQNVYAFSGHRVTDDVAQNFIFALEDELGDTLDTNFRYTDESGNVKSGACTIAAIDNGGGDAGAKKECGFEMHLNGKPTRTPHTAAAALTATVAPGTAAGMTSFTATVTAPNFLAYKLTAATQGTVYGSSYPENYVVYTTGGDIVASVGQYLGSYELDANKRVVKFLETLLDAADFPA